MVYKFSKTRTSRLYTIYGHLVKLSKRTSINGEAPYVISSYRCEFCILKFVCALWRRLSLLRIKREELYSKIHGTGNVSLSHCVKKMECILVT